MQRALDVCDLGERCRAYGTRIAGTRERQQGDCYAAPRMVADTFRWR
jgi:hypothetical protein